MMDLAELEKRAAAAAPRSVWLVNLRVFSEHYDRSELVDSLGLDPAYGLLLDAMCVTAVLAKRHPEYLVALYRDMPPAIEAAYVAFVDDVVNMAPIVLDDRASTQEA